MKNDTALNGPMMQNSISGTSDTLINMRVDLLLILSRVKITQAQTLRGLHQDLYQVTVTMWAMLTSDVWLTVKGNTHHFKVNRHKEKLVSPAT